MFGSFRWLLRTRFRENIPESALARDAAGRLPDDVIYAPNVKRNAFTQMAENHLQIRVSIEQARRHQAQRVGAGLHREGPRGRGQPGETVENWFAGRQRIAWMHVKWLAERVRAVPKVGKLRRVIIHDRLRTPGLREAVDHKAVKAKRLDTAFELERRRVRILHRQGRKPAQFRGVARDMLGKGVVGASRNINGLFDIWDALNAGRVERED